MPLGWRDIAAAACCWAMLTWLRSFSTMLHSRSETKSLFLLIWVLHNFNLPISKLILNFFCEYIFLWLVRHKWNLLQYLIEICNEVRLFENVVWIFHHIFVCCRDIYRCVDIFYRIFCNEDRVVNKSNNRSLLSCREHTHSQQKALSDRFPTVPLIYRTDCAVASQERFFFPSPCGSFRAVSVGLWLSHSLLLGYLREVSRCKCVYAYFLLFDYSSYIFVFASCNYTNYINLKYKKNIKKGITRKAVFQLWIWTGVSNHLCFTTNLKVSK